MTLVFMPIAALFAIQLADGLAGPLPRWLPTAGTVFLLAQPVFSLRLVADLRALPRWMLPLAVGGFAIAATLLIVSTGQPSLPLILVAVAVFVVTEAVAAGYLALEAAQRRGSARSRLTIAALATAGLALAILVAGAAAATDVPATVSGILIRVIALLAAIGYGIAFLPPRWLSRAFQASEAFAYHERILASPPSAEPGDLWTELARATHQLTGASVVILALDGPELRVVGMDGVVIPEATTYPAGALAAAGDGTGGDAVTRDLVARTGLPFSEAVPVVRDRTTVGLVYLLRRRASLVGTDDATLVALLAARSANLVQRRQVLAEQERLSGQLRLTVDALQAASAAKSDFLASMSHELRTPLNAIVGFSELMVADAGDADPLTVPREWVDHIRNGGRHLVALINDVLDLSKVEAGRLEIT
ncbi:MAG: histidine kinase dimerization/phospho-acceptor domain-containing protein, partial [Thermoleophilaceae bacterium]